MLCPTCTEGELQSLPSRCYRCHKVSMQHALCHSCRKITGLEHVWIGASYEGLAKELIHSFKYERAKAAYKDIVRQLDQTLPLLPKDTLVVHLPTVQSRIRQRGYDQAALIAKNIARKRGYEFSPLLLRVSHTRQVGSGRADRFEHLKDAFVLKNAQSIEGKSVLLVDDVMTTGATLESAAKLIRGSKPKSIDGLVFAHSSDL